MILRDLLDFERFGVSGVFRAPYSCYMEVVGSINEFSSSLETFDMFVRVRLFVFA